MAWLEKGSPLYAGRGAGKISQNEVNSAAFNGIGKGGNWAKWRPAAAASTRFFDYVKAAAIIIRLLFNAAIANFISLFRSKTESKH